GFSLAYAVNGVAMPLVGGTSSWLGPVIGAILLGTLQQVATVTISSALNLLIVCLMLVSFVIVAPNGILGLLPDARERLRRPVAGRSRAGQRTHCSRCQPWANALAASWLWRRSNWSFPKRSGSA